MDSGQSQKIIRRQVASFAGQTAPRSEHGSIVVLVLLSPDSRSLRFRNHSGNSWLTQRVPWTEKSLSFSSGMMLGLRTPSSCLVPRSWDTPPWRPLSGRCYVCGHVAYDHVSSSGVESLQWLCRIQHIGNDEGSSHRSAFHVPHVRGGIGKH
jgi:hypothetical protein